MELSASNMQLIRYLLCQKRVLRIIGWLLFISNFPSVFINSTFQRLGTTFEGKYKDCAAQNSWAQVKASGGSSSPCVILWLGGEKPVPLSPPALPYVHSRPILTACTLFYPEIYPHCPNLSYLTNPYCLTPLVSPPLSQVYCLAPLSHSSCLSISSLSPIALPHYHILSHPNVPTCLTPLSPPSSPLSAP